MGVYNMKHIYGLKNIKLLEDSVVILGNFDGIHIGHQKLFQVAKEVGKEKALPTVLFSFFPHPTWVLGDSPKSLLMSREEKKSKVEKLGIDIYIEYPFSAEFGKKSAEDFVTNILLEKLSCKAVVIGNNYFFGKKQQGNVDYMKKLGSKYGFEVFVVDEIKEEDVTVSSTFIRDLLLKGNVDLANKLIGHPYTVKGTIVHGKQLGRTLGFPTVNVIPESNKVLPPNGVYITKSYLLGKVYNSITNIGNRPTVAGKETTVETFIFDFAQDVYGETIIVEIIKYIRPELKFNSLQELTDAMSEDKAMALEYIAQQ